MAQDTGSAITGAVRADWFAGWGPEAGELAGRLKQPLADVGAVAQVAVAALQALWAAEKKRGLLAPLCLPAL
jgi:membrane-bound lytic murein transglycosylase